MSGVCYIHRAGSCAIDFTQLGHGKSVLGLNKKNWKSIENYSIFYLVPKHFLSIELFVEQRPWKFGRSDNSIWIGYHLREEHIMLPLFLLH